MTNPLTFDGLQDILRRRMQQVPDHRKEGPNTRYSIQDAALGAFGIFFTQSPSFLDYQRRLQQTKGQNNARTLFGVERIPCDNQVRNLLDPIVPATRALLQRLTAFPRPRERTTSCRRDAPRIRALPWCGMSCCLFASVPSECSRLMRETSYRMHWP